MPSNMKLTDEMKDFVRSNYKVFDDHRIVQEMIERFGIRVHWKAVNSLRRKLTGEQRYVHKWAPAEREFIRVNAATMKDREMAQQLRELFGPKFNPLSVQRQRLRMGIKKEGARGKCKVVASVASPRGSTLGTVIPWSEEELCYIRTNWRAISDTEIAEHLTRISGRKIVRDQVKALRKKRGWTADGPGVPTGRDRWVDKLNWERVSDDPREESR